MTTTLDPTTATLRVDGGVLLADALSVNASTSAATGALLVLGSPWLDGVVGAPAWVLAVIGVGLVLFALGIVVALSRPATLRRDAALVVGADVAWVLAAAAVVSNRLLTTAGDVLLSVVSIVVAGFAVAQVVGLRRTRPGDRVGVRPITLTASRDVPASPAHAWAVVADAAGYDAFAPGIVATTTDGPVRDGMVRTCVDGAGRSWTETCELVLPEREYRMEVDTSSYPRRLRALLDGFGMSWRVTPRDDGGSRIAVTFSGGVKLGVVSRVALWAAARRRPHETVVERYAAALGGGRSPTG